MTIRWARHVSGMGERRNNYKISIKKPERKRPFGRPKGRWRIILRLNL
jgi:hypothetical protein